MIQATLNGKSLGYEYKEDILTSTVFGTLKHIRPSLVLIPFIESAFLYNANRTTLRNELSNKNIELRHYKKVEYIFWTSSKKFGEPDLILIFKEHIFGLEDLMLIIEVKFKSGKSDREEKDQLAEYFKVTSLCIDSFTEPSVSNFKGKKGYIVYLTEAEAHSEIKKSASKIEEENPEVKNVDNIIFHLRWHQLHKTIEKMQKYAHTIENSILEDLLQYLEKLGLKDFTGISLPDKSLTTAFSSSLHVFYDQK